MVAGDLLRGRLRCDREAVTRMKRTKICGATVAAFALCVLVLSVVHPGLVPGRGAAERTLVQAAAWLVFAVGAWLVRTLPVRAAVLLIVVGGIGLQIAAFSSPPLTSSDSYRDVLDGRGPAPRVGSQPFCPGAPGVGTFSGASVPWG